MFRPFRSVLPALAVLVAVVALGPASVGVGAAGSAAVGAGGHAAVEVPLCGDVPAPGGLVTTTPAPDGLLVTANLTTAGDAPTVTVRERDDGYAVVVTTDTATRSAACHESSTVSVARRLPSDASEVVVVVNGERVGSVDGVGATTLS